VDRSSADKSRGMDSYVRNAVDGGRQIRPVGRGMDPRVLSLDGLT
jgi:hypothetical protein